MKIVELIRDSHQEFGDNHCMVLFSQGCNFKCHNCYNFDHVSSASPIGSAKDLLDRNITPMHEGVVFLGGKPTIWGDKLVEAARHAKQMGLKVKVFTNGSNPEVVAKLIENQVIDSFSVDAKCVKNCKFMLGIDMEEGDYLKRLRETIRIIKGVDVDVEIRTTDLVPRETLDVVDFVKTEFPGVNHIIQKDFHENALRLAFA